MDAEQLVRMIDATFNYFGSLGEWHKDPAGVDAVRKVRDRMVRDLATFTIDPSSAELATLCREWRAQRIEVGGPPSHPPDMFIESICEVIELS